MESKVYPGIHSSLNLDIFTESEKGIIRKFSREWYVTNGGEIKIGAKSNYKYFLIKPTASYTEMFNLDREIIAILSPYTEFEPRVLDSVDYVLEKFQTHRLEKICNVLISGDLQIEEKIRDLVNNEKESRVIIPFDYLEFSRSTNDYFLRNRFIEHFYSRDLFAFQAPLKKDLYFFGRTDIVNKIVNRHKSNEVSGLFGLRKTGKTSVIFGVERTLRRINEKCVFIDCENPSFHLKRWYKALHYIISEIISQNNLKIDIIPKEDYTEEDAAEIFESEILRIHEALGNKSILIIFDEIENITFKISPSSHWAEGLDFIFFWQTLRSLFQKLNSVFSYLIVGTNPMCVEVPTVQGKDNPIFNQVSFGYIPGFNVDQTREMVRRLGRIMGIKFEDLIYSKLTEDFGGHPFLIRNLCSIINANSQSSRPVTIHKLVYQKAKGDFNRESSSYFDMILQVLIRYYPNEYEMLKFLAIEDYESFNRYMELSPNYLNHLLGYRIIGKEDGKDQYFFEIESVKDYLVNEHRYEKLSLTCDEMLNEVSVRRNKLEPELRRIVRNNLLVKYGKDKSKEIVLDILGGWKKERCKDNSYEDLFDPKKSTIYFDDLRKIIIKNWDIFGNIFEVDKQSFDNMMTAINTYRFDAHAKEMTTSELVHFRSSIEPIEEKVYKFLS